MDNGLARSFPVLRTESPPSEVETGGLRVVIADDSVLLREGTARLLAEAGFDVVAQAGDADELLLRVRSYKPDIAIVDIRMPPTHTDEGVRAAERIREEHPDVAVLLLSQVVEPRRALTLFRDRPEGFGYLLKDRVLEIDDFVAAIRRVARGGTAVDPDVVSRLVGRRPDDDPLRDLSPLQLARPLSSRQSAARPDGNIADPLMLFELAVGAANNLLHIRARLGDHHRVHTVPPHYCRLAHAALPVEHALHVLGKHVEPRRRDDHLLLSTAHREPPLLIHRPDVPRPQPAIL